MITVHTISSSECDDCVCRDQWLTYELLTHNYIRSKLVLSFTKYVLRPPHLVGDMLQNCWNNLRPLKHLVDNSVCLQFYIGFTNISSFCKAGFMYTSRKTSLVGSSNAHTASLLFWEHTAYDFYFTCFEIIYPFRLC